MSKNDHLAINKIGEHILINNFNQFEIENQKLKKNLNRHRS